MSHKNKYKSMDGISRRIFINRAVTGTAVIALGPVTKLVSEDVRKIGAWPADASAYRFHMIGHAHIDPVWLWPWTEGISLVHSTFRSALDRMNETPDFTFIASSAQFYEWVSENDPGMLAEIRKRVDEGRWNLVGGWWVEPDVNIPSGESLVRQGLYGQLTLQRLLGHRAKVASNPDSFGHCGTLPQIIKSQGMDNYIFLRPGPNEKSLPADLFWWEGLDGSRVLTYRIQLSYNDVGPVRERIETILSQAVNQPMKSFMAYYGAGDHGGGATKENIRSVNALKIEKGAPAIFYSTPERYFQEIREKKLNIPVVKDDLQHHAVGCYTAGSEIKKGNRQAETALITAEKIAAIGSQAWQACYPKKELTTAWQRVLFLQFHDSLAGSSLFEHSQTALEGYGFALDIANQATYKAVQKLEWQIPAADPDSQYLLVFNPNAWEVSGKVEYDLSWGPMPQSSRVEDEKGNPLPHQWTQASSEVGNRKKLVVAVPIPPLGYRQIRLVDEKSPALSPVVRAEGNTLENELIRVRFSENGSIGLYDKEKEKELFSAGDNGCRAVIIDDPSDTWSHDIKAYNNEIGAFGNATLKILETGPLRAMIRTTAHYGNSTLTVDWKLYAGSRNLEANVILDWHEHLKMLKFSFPVDVESPVVTYETPYGHIIRAANGNEEPGQRWIDLSGIRQGSACGLTLINDAKYGYSASANDMRISVARSAVYAHHNPRVLDPSTEHLWMDQGIQHFRLLLVPHAESWITHNIARITEEFINPPVVIYQGIHGGTGPKSDSFLEVDAPNVVVTAIKLSENGDDVIIRCVETSGLPATATLDLRFAHQRWTGTFRPGEIKTLLVDHSTGAIKEVSLLEE